MAKKHRGVCSACNQKLPVEHTHHMNSALVDCLLKLSRASFTEPVNLSKSLGLGRNQSANFQKLRYFDLVEPYITLENSRKRGWWRLTERGRQFVTGQVKIQETVITLTSPVTLLHERVRYEGPAVGIFEIVSGYMYRGDYAALAASPQADHN